MELNRKNVRILLLIVAFGVALFVGLWHIGVVLDALGTVLGIASFFVIGLCAAFILNAPMRAIERYLFAPLNRRLGARWARVRRPLAMALTLLALLGVIFLVVFMIIPEMAETIDVLGKEFPGFIDSINAWLAQMRAQYGEQIPASLSFKEIDWAGMTQTVIDWLKNGAGSFFAGTLSAASSFVSAVFGFVVGMIVAFYVLAGKERLSRQTRRVLYAYLPEARADRLCAIGRQANRVFSGFITGQLTESLILGVLCFIGMVIFGFRFAPMVSVLVGITSLIPIFGAFIGVTVGAFMILVNQGFMTALWFVVFFVALQQVEGNLIYPHVVGKSVSLPGLWVLTAATLGGNIAGILGMVVSIPLCSLLYALLREAVDRRNAARGIAPEKLA